MTVKALVTYIFRYFCGIQIIIFSCLLKVLIHENTIQHSKIALINQYGDPIMEIIKLISLIFAAWYFKACIVKYNIVYSFNCVTFGLSYGKMFLLLLTVVVMMILLVASDAISI